MDCFNTIKNRIIELKHIKKELELECEGYEFKNNKKDLAGLKKIREIKSLIKINYTILKRVNSKEVRLITQSVH